MSEWKPISEAPKGRQILIFYKNEYGLGRTVKAFYTEKNTIEYNGDEDFGEYDEKTDNYYEPEGWYESIDNWDDYSHVLIHYEPTHFMELPTPPED